MKSVSKYLSLLSDVNHLTTLRLALIAALVLLLASIACAQTSATIASPANGSTVSGTITVSASISGSYASVVFWRDNWIKIGQSSSPDLSYNSGGLANGNHDFFVSVLDSQGNTLCASNKVTVNVQNTTTATMNSPSNGGIISGSITITATINAPNGYASVDFWVDNWVKIGQATSPQLSYNTATLANGNHNFFITVLDSSGTALAASNIVTANVQNQGIPQLTITSPGDGTTVLGTITVSTSVTGSVASVTFYSDSWSNPIGTVATTPYQISYNTTSLSNAKHTFWASAANGAGSGASNIVTVTVHNSRTGGCTPIGKMAQFDQNGFDMLAAFNNTNTGKSGPYFGAADTTWNGGWYFVNLGYLGYVDLVPDTVKGYIVYYLQNTNSDWSMGVMGQNRDSDDSYAATILSLASAYYRVTCDQEFFSNAVPGKSATVLEALKDVANNNLVNAAYPNGLVHVFQTVDSSAHDVAYTMDNSEDYKGLEDFGNFLNSIGDSGSTYLNAAANLAKGMQTLFQSNLYNGSNFLNQSGFVWAWFGSSGPGWMDNPITFYPDGTAQVFPQLYRVPLPSNMYTDGWNFLRNNFDFESPCGTGCDPWTSLGLAAAYNGDNSTANVMLTNTRNTGGTPIHEWGFYRRIVLYQEDGFIY